MVLQNYSKSLSSFSYSSSAGLSGSSSRIYQAGHVSSFVTLRKGGDLRGSLQVGQLSVALSCSKAGDHICVSVQPLSILISTLLPKGTVRLFLLHLFLSLCHLLSVCHLLSITSLGETEECLGEAVWIGHPAAWAASVPWADDCRGAAGANEAAPEGASEGAQTQPQPGRAPLQRLHIHVHYPTPDFWPPHISTLPHPLPWQTQDAPSARHGQLTLC